MHTYQSLSGAASGTDDSELCVEVVWLLLHSPRVGRDLNVRVQGLQSRYRLLCPLGNKDGGPLTKELASKGALV